MALKALFYPNVPFKTLYIPNIYKETYLDKIYNDIFNSRKKDMVIIDIGANIGIVTKFMRDYAKVVYAIEPSPENFEALKKNVEFNKWNNVIPLNFAISDKNGRANFQISLKNHTSNSLINKFYVNDIIQTTNVAIKSFDTFFKENNIQEVDFVKLDVEQAENIILHSDGFRNIVKQIKSIMIDFHNGVDYLSLIELMRTFKFKNEKRGNNNYLFTRL